jgi:hypothetical protein
MTPKLPDPMLQRCQTCKHHKQRDGGWCYMFKEKPLYLCCKPIYEPIKTSPLTPSP